MKSEIIDRILSENRESLQKIIETARNNDVFQDIMSNIKEEFFINLEKEQQIREGGDCQ